MSNGYDMLNPIDDGEVVEVDMREELQQVSTGGGIWGVAINGETQPYDEAGMVDIPLDVTKVDGKYVANNATSAKSAEKLSKGDAGSAKKPVYQKNGEFIEIEHEINADVPENAVFTDTTYDVVSEKNDGLMAKADKVKLDTIQQGANKTVVDVALNKESANPIANSVVANEFERKVNRVELGDVAYKNEVTKADVGLSNVTNDAQVKRTELGVAGGVATLDSSGKVPSAQLPSYVDDVLEYSMFAAFPYTGEDSKIYLDKSTNMIYRWGGSSYVPVNQSLALGETSSTAYAGDKGKKNADDIASILNGTTTVPNALNAQRAARADALGDKTVGSIVDPIYLDNGTPIACDLQGYIFKDIKADPQYVTSDFIESIYNKTTTSYTVEYDTRYYDNSHIKVGDTVYIYFDVTDGKTNVVALGVATSVYTVQGWTNAITFGDIKVIRGWKGDKGNDLKQIILPIYTITESELEAYNGSTELGLYVVADPLKNTHINVGDIVYWAAKVTATNEHPLILAKCTGKDDNGLNLRGPRAIRGPVGASGDNGTGFKWFNGPKDTRLLEDIEKYNSEEAEYDYWFYDEPEYDNSHINVGDVVYRNVTISGTNGTAILVGECKKNTYGDYTTDNIQIIPRAAIIPREGPQGPQGLQGPKGPQGEAGTFAKELKLGDIYPLAFSIDKIPNVGDTVSISTGQGFRESEEEAENNKNIKPGDIFYAFFKLRDASVLLDSGGILFGKLIERLPGYFIDFEVLQIIYSYQTKIDVAVEQTQALRDEVEADREAMSADLASFKSLSNDLQSKVDSGYFTGPAGPLGPKGDDGVSPEMILRDGLLYASYNSNQRKVGKVQGRSIFTVNSVGVSVGLTGYASKSNLAVASVANAPIFEGDVLVFSNGIVGVVTEDVSSSSSSIAYVSRLNIKGADGRDGYNITNIQQTTTSTESGGTNVITFTLSTGAKYSVQIKNGKDGSEGINGITTKEEDGENVLYLTKNGETFGDGIALPSGGGGGSTNFILNPDFSVNQRGQEEYTGTQTVDAWKQNAEEGYSVKSIPTANGVELKVSAENAEKGKALFTQRIEDVAKLEGKTVTLSVNASVESNAVPTNTYIEKIYFNTALSDGEVADILGKLPYSIAGFYEILVVSPETGKGIMAERRERANGYAYLLWDSVSTVYFATHSDFGDGTIGWHDFGGVVDFNGVSVSEADAGPVGAYNDQLAKVMAITPNFGGGLTFGYANKEVEAEVIPVPNDGSVIGTVYFNTAKTAEEVGAIITEANLPFISGMAEAPVYPICCCANGIGLFILDLGDGDYGIGWQNLVDGTSETIFYSGTGWANDSYTFNSASLTEAQGLQMGTHNDKLTQIMAMTPYFARGKATVVPNDGTVVQNIYINTSLSIDETVAIMQKVDTWYPLNSMVSAYFIASDATGAKGLAMFTMGGIYGLADFSVFNTGQGNIYFTSQPVADFGISTAGWQGISYCAFNDTTVSSAQGMSAGEENSKLVDLFSVTPYPSSGGTPVPNDGSLVETVYFNTAKTEEEWSAVASQLNFVEGFADFPMYPVLVTTTGDALAVVHQTSLGRYFLGVQNMGTGSETMIFVPNSFSDGSPSVWQANSYTFNANSQSVVQGVPIGTQNDLLIDFISTTTEFGSPSSGGVSGEFIPLKNGMNSLTFEAKNLKECGIYSSASMGEEETAIIHSIKLELGDKATDHLPVITNDEKVRCQRVYQPASLNGVVGYAKDESALAVSIPLPVSMRFLPSIESFETISILGGAEVTDVAVDSIENNSVQLSLTISGLTHNNLYVVENGKVWLSAESPMVRVLFYDGDKVLFDKMVVEGGEFSVPSDPTKESTAQYNYVFKGWSLDGVNVVDVKTVATSDLTYYALYEEQLRYYTVRFLDGDTVLQEGLVAYGETPVYAGETPVAPTDYEFTGWSPPLAPVTGNVDYVARFKFTKSITRQLVEKIITEYSNDTIVNVGSFSFRGCGSLTSVDLPNVTSIGENAFGSCNALTSVSFPNTTSLGAEAFRGCGSLTSVDLPNVTSIGASTFYSCNRLTNIPLQKVTSIGRYAFYYCRGLTSVSLPKVTSLSENAFYSCANLTSVTLPATPPTLENVNAFSSVSTTCVFHIPAGSLSAYQSATNWSTLIGQYTFQEDA